MGSCVSQEAGLALVEGASHREVSQGVIASGEHHEATQLDPGWSGLDCPARLRRARDDNSNQDTTSSPGIAKPIARARDFRHVSTMPPLIRPATPADTPLILAFIRDLAAYEKLSDEVAATESQLHRTLFAAPPVAHCVLAFSPAAQPQDEPCAAHRAKQGLQPAGFAIYFFNYSTFLAKPGLYLEDLFVQPEFRGRGIGRALLLHLAQLANARDCGRMEWSVLDWNQPAIDFYEKLGARRMREWQICRLTGPALAQYA
jgi:GNAT superfamily N-acetyltransferase